MSDKPPLPPTMFDPWPRITIDATSLNFERILGLGISAADNWTFGPDGPYRKPGQTGAQTVHNQLREALLYLLELGVIDIDADRLNAAKGWPLQRQTGGDS